MEQNYANRARSRPLSPAVLADLGALQGLSPPAGPFDPEAAWEHTYRVWAVAGGPARSNIGYLRLQRQPQRDGRAVSLTVEKRLQLMGGDAYLTKAQITCATDALATPRSWRLESVIIGTNGEPSEAVSVTESVNVGDGKLRVKVNGRSETREAPSSLTTDWGLFDVVQRLPLDKTQPLEFAVLEELDMLKEGHRLSYREAGDFQLNGQKLRLACYQMLGHGLLPYQYWVDERRRLLMAISHTRAYVFDPEAAARLAQPAQQPGRRQGQ